MKKPIKILILEDSFDDIILIERELQKAGIDFTSVVVNKKAEFQSALNDFQPDVVLADHSLPQFNSIEALELCRAHQEDFKVMIPFILITGQVSEQFAVQCFKAGVDDYILKDRLKRLPLAIESVLAKYDSERQKLKIFNQLMSSQALMKEAEHLAKFGSWEVNLINGKHTWSDEMFNIYGYEKPGAIEPDFEKFFNHVYPGDILRLKTGFENALANMDSYQIDFRIIDNKGNIRHISSDQKVNRNADGMPVRLVGFNLDITERRNLESKLQKVKRTENHFLIRIVTKFVRLIHKG